MARIIETITSKSCEIPPLYILGKDHKRVLPGQLPKTRQVMENCRGMGIHLSNQNSDILEPLANKLGMYTKFVSTEDLLNQSDTHNDNLESMIT